MGTYVYHTTKKTCKVEIDGVAQTVNEMKFICRASALDTPVFGSDKGQSLLKARLARMENSYERCEYIALTDDDKGFDGADVYVWGKSHGEWTDSTELGKRVGRIVRVGRRYKLIPPLEADILDVENKVQSIRDGKCFIGGWKFETEADIQRWKNETIAQLRARYL